MADWSVVEEFADNLVERVYALEAIQVVPTVSDQEFLEMGRRLQRAIDQEYQKVTGQYIVKDHLKLHRFRLWLEPDMEGDWSLLAPGIVRMILDWEAGLGCEPATLEGYETPSLMMKIPDALTGETKRRIKVRHYYGLRE